MVDRVEMGAYDGKVAAARTAMVDALRLGQSASLAAAGLRVGSSIEATGFRRYRLKCIQLTGAGPTRIRALDLPFDPVAANVWVAQVLAAAQATATRFAYDFGEGGALSTGAALTLTNFMGPYLAIELQNNGVDAATYEIELWMQ